MAIVNKLLLLICMVLFAGYTHAQGEPKSKQVEFSADAVISIPNQTIRQTKLYVSGAAVRSEMQFNGQNVVEIVYPEEGRAVLINDPVRSYKERSFNIDKNKQKNIDLCAQIANAVCEKLGTEKIDGFNTEKWQIISNSQGKPLRTLHWIDVKRKLALREFFPDGTMAELKMVKKEIINGRNTEKWQRTLSRPDGTKTQSYQWYDTGLGIAIREELPGGYIRELKNIKIARQPAKLFKVPEDYTKVEAPVMPMQTNYAPYN